MISSLMTSSKQHIKMAALAIALAAIILGAGFIYEMLVVASYI